MEVKNKALDRLRQRNKLHMAESQIQTMIDQIEQQRVELAADRLRFQDEKKELEKIVKINSNILKSNEVFLFAIKENIINTVRDYEQVANILDKVMKGKGSRSQTEGMLIGIESKIANLQDLFSLTFRQTTDQFLANADRSKELN